jgi:DNA-directed RNA polymerase specialized sigma24 family protein
VRTDPINEATEAGHADDAPLPSDTAERNELRAIVRDGIAALPEKHRSVVVLYYLQRLSLQERGAQDPARHREVAFHYAPRAARPRA